MKTLLIATVLISSSALLASCGANDAPLTESEQAAQYNMSTGAYQETKEAAARMNMTVEDHMNMTDGDMSHGAGGAMDMRDDSHMIEDDSMMR
ncbi:MAG TPA: hypothetical protein PK765_06845 [bacterium]|nr:hypothetical protein [bacterium]